MFTRVDNLKIVYLKAKVYLANPHSPFKKGESSFEGIDSPFLKGEWKGESPFNGRMGGGGLQDSLYSQIILSIFKLRK